MSHLHSPAPMAVPTAMLLASAQLASRITYLKPPRVPRAPRIRPVCVYECVCVCTRVCVGTVLYARTTTHVCTPHRTGTTPVYINYPAAHAPSATPLPPSPRSPVPPNPSAHKSGREVGSFMRTRQDALSCLFFCAHTHTYTHSLTHSHSHLTSPFRAPTRTLACLGHSSRPLSFLCERWRASPMAA